MAERGKSLAARGPEALLLLSLACASASNWAQISGDDRQNVADAAPSPFTRRWGHAFAAMETLITDRTVDVLFETERSRLYVLGGDSWRRDTSAETSNAGYNLEHFFANGRPRDPNYNLADNEWADTGSGNLLNDVWWSIGASWDVFVDDRNPGAYGDPRPTFVSQTVWNKMPDWTGVPAEMADWREYLGCCHANPVPCADKDEYGATLCPTAFVCQETDQYGENLCSTQSIYGGADPYAAQRRWSPRRGHAALTVYPLALALASCPTGFLGTAAPCGQDASGATVWPAAATLIVLGGRARSLQRMTGLELNGGFIGNSLDPAMTERHRSILMSDVWITSDGAGGGAPAGATWDVINQGCWVAQADQVKPPGILSGVCATDYDCWLKDFGDAVCFNRACTCRHWTPRERFGSAVHLTDIFIAGGVSYSETLLCGHASCGTEYATFLNDVWVSHTLGQTWVELTPAALWAPRADLALVWAASMLWVLGGRGGDVRNFGFDPLYSDSYASRDGGATWFLNSTNGGWTARSNHAVVVFEPSRADDGRLPGTRFVLLFGQEQVILVSAKAATVYSDYEQVANAAAEAPTNVNHVVVQAYAAPPDGELVNSMQVVPIDSAFSLYPSVASAAQDLYGRTFNVWWRDFGPGSPQGSYLGIDAADGFAVLNYTAAQLAVLANASIGTIYELSVAPKETMVSLSDPTLPTFFPGSICYEFRRAQYLVQHCDVAAIGYDGDWFATITVLEGTPPIVAAPVENDGCDSVPPGSFGSGDTSPWWVSPTGTRYEETDYVCRQAPRARRSFGSALMSEGQGILPRIYMSGGWEGGDIFSNDVWYRDERLPRGFFTDKPDSGTPESVFSWDCLDDLTDLVAVCVFEYRMWDEQTQTTLRNWQRAASPFDALGINYHNRATRFDLRAVDPAGNRDGAFEYGRNQWVWTYVPPFPVVAVTVSITIVVAIIIFTLYRIRQYEKRIALEIYMAKRLARKLRAEGAGIKKRVKVLKRKNKGPPRTSVDAIRDASERDKYKALLGGRAERTSRIAIEVQQVSKKMTAKDRFMSSSKATAATAVARRDVSRDAENIRKEASRAQAVMRGRSAYAESSTSKLKLSAAAPSLSEPGIAVATPAYALTLQQFKQKAAAKRQAEEEAAAVTVIGDDPAHVVVVGSSGRQRLQLPPLSQSAEAVVLPGQVRKDL